MLSLLPTTRVFVCTHPTDMRKGFDGLAALTVEVVKQNPLSGHLFVFRTQSRNLWDRRHLAGAGDRWHADG
jgi:transposase